MRHYPLDYSRCVCSAAFCFCAAAEPRLPSSSASRCARARAARRAAQLFARPFIFGRLFTVLDRRNKLVPTLEKQDFKVLDDNIPQRSATSANRAISTAHRMLLDTQQPSRSPKFEQAPPHSCLASCAKKDEASDDLR